MKQLSLGNVEFLSGNTKLISHQGTRFTLRSNWIEGTVKGSPVQLSVEYAQAPVTL